MRTYLRAATEGEVADERWQLPRRPRAGGGRGAAPTHAAEVPGHGRVRRLLPRAAGRVGDRSRLRAQARSTSSGWAQDRALLLPPVDGRAVPDADHRAGVQVDQPGGPHPQGLPRPSRAGGVRASVARSIGREYAAGGQALAAGLLAGPAALGIPVWTSSPLKDLVVKDGRVVGVVVSRGGAQGRHRAGPQGGDPVRRAGSTGMPRDATRATSPTRSTAAGAWAPRRTPAR